MTYDQQELSLFLGVEGQNDPNAPEAIVYRLCRPSGEVLLTVLNDRDAIEIEIVGSDSAVLFEAVFECVSLSIQEKKPNKLKPHVEMRLKRSNQDVCEFHLGGPPDYYCEFLSMNIK